MGLGVQMGEKEGERSGADSEEGHTTGEFGKAFFDHA